MPFFNQDAMLSFDLDAGNSTNASSTGVTYTDGSTTVRCSDQAQLFFDFHILMHDTALQVILLTIQHT